MKFETKIEFLDWRYSQDVELIDDDMEHCDEGGYCGYEILKYNDKFYKVCYEVYYYSPGTHYSYQHIVEVFPKEITRTIYVEEL